MTYDHAQSRMMMMSVYRFRENDQHMLADAFWKIAKHYAMLAHASYKQREKFFQPIPIEELV